MGVFISSHKGAANWRIAAGGALATNGQTQSAMRSAFARNAVKRNKLQQVNHMEIKFFFSSNML